MNFLHTACKQRNFKLVVDCLTEMDIHIDCTTYNNTTPLMLAVRNPISKKNYKQIYNIVEVLLEHGANPNCYDLERETVLHKTLQHIPHVKKEKKYLLPIIKLLLSHNANPSMKNKDGDTCYKMAFDYGSCRIGTLLALSDYFDETDYMKNTYCNEFYRYDNASCPSYDEVCRNGALYQVISWQSHHQP